MAQHIVGILLKHCNMTNMVGEELALQRIIAFRSADEKRKIENYECFMIENHRELGHHFYWSFARIKLN
jgi:hypothetical protein